MNLLETTKVTAISRLRVTAAWRGSSAPTRSSSAVYNPPPGYVVLDTQTVRHSSNNGSREVSVLAGGVNIATEAIIDEAYSAAISAAAASGNDELRASLEEKHQSHLSEIRRYAASHNTIQATVRATPHGSKVDRRRGWEEISVTANLIYLGALDFDDLVASLEEEFEFEIPDPE